MNPTQEIQEHKKFLLGALYEVVVKLEEHNVLSITFEVISEKEAIRYPVDVCMTVFATSEGEQVKEKEQNERIRSKESYLL